MAGIARKPRIGLVESAAGRREFGALGPTAEMGPARRDELLQVHTGRLVATSASRAPGQWVCASWLHGPLWILTNNCGNDWMPCLRGGQRVLIRKGKTWLRKRSHGTWRRWPPSGRLPAGTPAGRLLSGWVQRNVHEECNCGGRVAT